MFQNTKWKGLRKTSDTNLWLHMAWMCTQTGMRAHTPPPPPDTHTLKTSGSMLKIYERSWIVENERRGESYSPKLIKIELRKL